MVNRVSQRVQAVAPSGIRRFFDIAATMDGVISLGIGEPDFVTPDVIRRAGIASLERGETRYTSNSGIQELREALSDHLHRLYGVDYHPDRELLVTVGASEAVYLALTAVLDPGDEVIIPQPSFVSYPAEVLLATGTPVPVATTVEEGFTVTRAQIEAAVTSRTKAMILSYPNNPTGAVATRERLTEIAALAHDNDVLVISDEIYDRLVYGVEHICFPALPNMRERTVLIGGFSKDYAMTGWRLGYAAGPEDIIGAMRKVHQYTIMSASTTAQRAAIVALTDPAAQDAVEEMRQSYDERRRLMVAGFNAIGMPCFEPGGAFYTFPSVAASGMDSETFAWTLLEEEQVAVVPGPAFGVGGEGFVRACYATEKSLLERALERTARFVRRHG